MCVPVTSTESTEHTLLSPPHPPCCRMEDDLLAGTVSPESAAAAVAPSPMAAMSPTSTPTASGLSWGSDAMVGSEGGLPRETPKVGCEPEGAGGGAAPAAKAPPCPELALLLEVVDRLDGTGGSTWVHLITFDFIIAVVAR